MNKNEIKNYLGIKDRGFSMVTKIMKKNNISFNDIFIKNDKFIGLWDKKNNIPLFKSLTEVKIICKKCGEKHVLKYNHWLKKENEHKHFCSSCGRSQTLIKLNKTKIRDNNIKMWQGEKGEKLKDIFKEKRIQYNKDILPQIIKSFSEEKKNNIKNKKITTWLKKPEIEREKINKIRNCRLCLTKIEKEQLNQKIRETLLSKKEYLSKNAKKRWNKLPKQEKEKRLEHLKHGYIKKKHNLYDIYYQGSYENKFLNECFKNSMIVKRGPGIEYYNPIKKKICIYLIDFEINNYLIEVKSKWWWLYHLKENIAKRKAAKSFVAENGYKGYILYIFDNIKKEEINLDILKN